MSTKEDNSGKESNEPDYDEDKDQLKEKQEEESGDKKQQIKFSDNYYSNNISMKK